MVCPKCNEEKLVTATLKKNNEKAHVCEACGTLWFANEKVTQTTGHTFDVLTRDGEFAYTIENAGDKDQEHTSADYTPYK